MRHRMSMKCFIASVEVIAFSSYENRRLLASTTNKQTRQKVFVSLSKLELNDDRPEFEVTLTKNYSKRHF